MSALFDQALAEWAVVREVLEENIERDLCGDDEVREGREQLDRIGAALEAALQLQQDIESIDTYGRAHRVLGPTIFFNEYRWHGHITDTFDSMCDGSSYAEVHSELAKWCRAEMAK